MSSTTTKKKKNVIQSEPRVFLKTSNRVDYYVQKRFKVNEHRMAILANEGFESEYIVCYEAGDGNFVEALKADGKRIDADVFDFIV